MCRAAPSFETCRNARNAQAAAFDTRLDRSPWFTGVASRGIAKRLRRRGYEVIGTESFLVEDSEGPLADGGVERALAWGAEVARSLRSVQGENWVHALTCGRGRA